jgi:anthranilate synthase/aminodeoxychorismate synthase-like glutamine amidotransferase
MIVVIDNYDSFVHNLARYFLCAGMDDVRVIRNDALSVEELRRLDPLAIVLSPGPCSPNEAGICIEAVQKLGAEIPILGVCLGHQAIAQAYGGECVRAAAPCHGKSSRIHHNGQGIFARLPSPLEVGRYHSLIADIVNAPALRPLAYTEGENLLMAFQHERHPVYGVQFHPESILTQYGHEMIGNFIALAREWRAQDKHQQSFAA